MSEWNGNSLDLQELAQLPPDDPRRRELQSRLAMMDSAERAYWQEQLRQTDHIYSLICTDDLPDELNRRLMRIPDEEIVPVWRRLLDQPVGWGHWAAAIILVIGLIGMLVWNSMPSRSIPVPELNSNIANIIAAMALSHRSAPVQIANANPGDLQTALGKLDLPFPPMVLKPTTPLTLHGGGVFDYRSAKVVYTRWSDQGVTYTLYQFDGTKLGAPPVFAAMTVTTANTGGYKVREWPGAGGQCTWALVLQSSAQSDPFSGRYY